MNHGNSGLAHGTNGSPQMTLENNELAAKSKELERLNVEIAQIASTIFDKNNLSYRLSKEKIESYLLDINHSQGSSKAKFFIETLGYSKDNPKQFYDNLSDAIHDKIPHKVMRTKYGIVCEFHEIIKGIKWQI